jgi:bifunctional non-homologous end joining protein LigD
VKCLKGELTPPAATQLAAKATFRLTRQNGTDGIDRKMTEPAFVPPMLAKLVRTLPEGPEWEYELKLDGYRLEAIRHGEKVRLYSRRGNDYTKKFARIAANVSKIKATSFVVDGEAVAVDEQGKPSFQMLQNRSSLPEGWALAYYAFDLLHLDGKDLKTCPLHERRALLETVLSNSGVLLSQSLPGTLSQIMGAVTEHGLEGVIAKRLDSPCQSSQRANSWLKLPLNQTRILLSADTGWTGSVWSYCWLAILKTKSCYLPRKSIRD